MSRRKDKASYFYCPKCGAKKLRAEFITDTSVPRTDRAYLTLHGSVSRAQALAMAEALAAVPQTIRVEPGYSGPP